jgi:hypothetical protein
VEDAGVAAGTHFPRKTVIGSSQSNAGLQQRLPGV